MKKFLLGVLAGIIIAGVAGIVLVFASVRFVDRVPPLPDRTCLVLNLAGELPEISALALPLPALEDRAPLTMVDLYQTLRDAAEDPRVAGILLKPRNLRAGWGKLSELRRGLEEVRKAGKPVYAWLQTPGMREYYLATAAEQVFVAPEDFLDVKGLRLQAMYFKGALSKLGVQVEVEHAGKYKDAGDIFSRSSMSPETREALNSILDDLYPRLAGALADGRRMKPEQMLSLIDQGPFLAPKARERGLVDELVYERSATERLARRAGVESQNFVTARRYLAGGGWRPRGSRKRVAVLVAQGDILRSSGGDLFGEEQTITPRAFNRHVVRVAEDDSIAGVIVRVDSPGGDALASDEILNELKKLSTRKPVVFSMSDVAASGGYYIAMTGDPVVAYPDTLTGSIGVVYGKVNLKGLYANLGISVETLKRGRFADIDSSTGPLTPEARQKLREGIEFIYAGFLRRVAEGRRKKPQEIEPLAQGRVWLGSQARSRDLVDELGGFKTALDLLREKANIAPEERIALVIYPPRRTLLQQLFSRQDETGVELPPAARAMLRQAGPGLTPWLTGGMLRALPYRLEFQ